MIRIAGDITGFTACDPTSTKIIWLTIGPFIPNIQTFTIFIISSFNLISCCCGTKTKCIFIIRTLGRINISIKSFKIRSPVSSSTSLLKTLGPKLYPGHSKRNLVPNSLLLQFDSNNPILDYHFYGYKPMQLIWHKCLNWFEVCLNDDWKFSDPRTWFENESESWKPFSAILRMNSADGRTFRFFKRVASDSTLTSTRPFVKWLQHG